MTTNGKIFKILGDCHLVEMLNPDGEYIQLLFQILYVLFIFFFKFSSNTEENNLLLH